MAMAFYNNRTPFRSKCSIILCLLDAGNVTCKTVQMSQVALVLAEPQPTLHIAKTIYCQISLFK